MIQSTSCQKSHFVIEILELVENSGASNDYYTNTSPESVNTGALEERS